MSIKLKNFLLDKSLAIILYLLLLFFVFRGANRLEQAVGVIFGVIFTGSCYLEYKGAYIKSFFVDKFTYGVLYLIILRSIFLQGDQVLFFGGIIFGLLAVVSSYFEYRRISQ